MVLGKLPVPGRPTIWIIVGQGPIALAVGAGGGCLDIFTLIYPLSPLSPSLWETARYRLKYCLKGPLNPKQPTNQFIDNHGLCLYNTKSPTYLHPATGTFTSLDLSICFPTLPLDHDWEVHDDLCGSDHFPILLNNIGPDLDEPVSRWKLNKANWTQFQTLCTTRLLEDTVWKADDPIESFASILIYIAEITVPKSSTKSKKAKKPSFTDDC